MSDVEKTQKYWDVKIIWIENDMVAETTRQIFFEHADNAVMAVVVCAKLSSCPASNTWIFTSAEKCSI